MKRAWRGAAAPAVVFVSSEHFVPGTHVEASQLGIRLSVVLSGRKIAIMAVGSAKQVV